MATGASTADVAILLVDARHGVRVQSRRHAKIARLLGIYDLRARRQQDGPGRFRPRRCSTTISDEFRRLAAGHHAARHSDERAARRQRDRAERSDAVVRTARACSSSSSTSRSIAPAPDKPLRFPVQLVLRPNHEFRGYAGQILSGTVRPGEHGHRLAVRRRHQGPANRRVGRRSRVAIAPMSVTLVLDDEVDVSRGDVIASGDDRGRIAVRGRDRLDGRAPARSRAHVPAEAGVADRDGGGEPRPRPQSDRIGDGHHGRSRSSSIATPTTARPAASSSSIRRRISRRAPA